MNIIVHPISHGGAIEFHSANPKQKAWIKLQKTNAGHYYLQFHAACGLLTSYIHQVSCGVWCNENGLFIPKYALKLIESANKYLNSLMGN